MVIVITVTHPNYKSLSLHEILIYYIGYPSYQATVGYSSCNNTIFGDGQWASESRAVLFPDHGHHVPGVLHVHADLGVAGLGGEVVLEPLAVGPTLAVGLTFLDGIDPDCRLGGFQK